MNPELFLADLEAKPAALLALAEAEDPFRGLSLEGIRRVVFVGMGSSRYAAGVAALRLRAHGVDAVAEYASAISYALPPGTLLVPISATGGSRETLDALAPHQGRTPIVAITNAPDSPVTEGATHVIPMLAGEEKGGVACRTFQHTLALLLALESHLTNKPNPLPGLLRLVSEATYDLLEKRDTWLPRVLELLDGPHGVYAIAPAERLSSAEQSALMVREGPRRQADACETGDWSHVDVYLAKTYDYRALFFPGSRYDEQAMEWLRLRESTVVAIGSELPGATHTLRYRHDDNPDVALLTETLPAELVAATWWSANA